MKYIELHIADHCNVNCKGCTHFSNIAPKWFYDLEQFDKDMKRFGSLVNLNVLKILGGEPLLNKDINKYLTIARKHLPHTHIVIGSNGVLLKKMPEEFWEKCKEVKAIISVSVYPNTFTNVDKQEVKLLSEQYGVEVILKAEANYQSFDARMNIDGNSDKNKAFDYCHKIVTCPFLRDGKLYPCAQSGNIHILNNKFGLNIPSDVGLDLHKDINIDDINTYLKTPIETCKWCAESSKRVYKWSNDKNVSIKDWDNK